MWTNPSMSSCFFFQAADGIRVHCVTGVQTCALPISGCDRRRASFGGQCARINHRCRARSRLCSRFAHPVRGLSLSARYCSQRGEQLTINAMLNRAAATAISLLIATNGFGQSPAPSSVPTANSPAVPAKPVAPSSSPTPGTEQIIDSLGEGDLQTAIALLKSNFTNPDAITDTELNRATLTGLLARMPGGLMLLPPQPRGESATPEPAASLYSEVFDGHIGYLRLGSLNSANLKE